MEPKLSIDLSIPIYNEEKALRSSIKKLQKYLKKNLTDKYSIKIILVDNASTDTSLDIAKKLAKKYKIVNCSHLEIKGRGRALKQSWKISKADILAYMDVDLSAELNYFPKLINAIEKEKYDIAIGSRLKRGAKVYGRTLLREILSRSYNILIKILFNTPFHDAQCGFKAISRDTFARIEPIIKNQNWFFDSELLIIATKLGYKIKEIPISWKDDPSSTVKVVKTANEDIMGLYRLAKEKPWKNI